MDRTNSKMMPDSTETSRRSSSTYLPHIDGLRAVAVVAVVLYHLDARFLPGGFVGVDIFFVISGFVVSRSVSAMQGISFPAFMAYFYARRLTRIVPALCACLLITTLATILFIPYAWLSGTSQRTGLAAFFGLSNFVLAATTGDYFSPRAEFNSFTHTWSLGVEEQYYLIFPLLFIFWLRGFRKTSILAFVAIAVLSFVLAIPAASTQPDRAFYLIYYRFWELAAGALLFQLWGDRGVGRGARIGAAASLLAIGVALLTASPHSVPFPGAILPVAGTVGFILFGRSLPPSSMIRRGFSHAVPIYIGRISYSLYLFHWPTLVLFRWTVGLDSTTTKLAALCISFALAALSYRWVETPPRRRITAARLPPLVAVGMGLATLLLGWGVASGIWSLRPMISLSAVSRHNADWLGDNAAIAIGGCKIITKPVAVGGGSGQYITRSACDRPVSLKRRIFVVGDSHAYAYELLLKQTVMDTGAAVEWMSFPGCGSFSFFYEVTPSCLAFQNAAIAHIEAALAPGDIVFLPSLRLPRISDQFALFDEAAAIEQVHSTNIAARRAEQETALAAFIQTLAGSGVTMVLEAPPPVFRSPVFRCVDWFTRVNPICVGGLTIPRDRIETLRRPVLDVFDRLQRRFGNVHVWDPMPTLCPTETCDAMRDGHPLFFDGDHLSSFGNRLLTGSFEAFLARLPGSSGQ